MKNKPKKVTYIFSKTKVQEIARVLGNNPDAGAFLDLMEWGGRIRIDDTKLNVNHLRIESAKASPRLGDGAFTNWNIPCWNLDSDRFINLAEAGQPLKVKATVGDDGKLCGNILLCGTAKSEVAK